MAILKRESRVWRVSRESSSLSDEDSREHNVEADSSDSCEGSDVGEIGSELCRVGKHNCNIPYELFDLPDLKPILSLDTWNYCLTDEERFSLSVYLPDMDQDTFMHTLKQLLAGENFHFGSPLLELFEMLKGGLCQPAVSRYRQCLEYLQRKAHYHFLRKYQNNMVENLVQMKETWQNCTYLGIEERLHRWNSWKNLKALALSQAESQSLSHRHSKQMLELMQKGRPGKSSAWSIKCSNFVKDDNMLKGDPSLLKRKGLATENDGQCSLVRRLPLKSQLHSHLLEGIEKMGKPASKGVPKMAPKYRVRNNGLTEEHLESDQRTPFSEMQDSKTDCKFSSAVPHISKWEVDDLVEEAPYTMRKTRSRTRINGLETTFNNTKGHQPWNLLNGNSGLVESTLEHCRTFGKVKKKEISDSMDMREAPTLDENVGRYKGENGLAGGNTTFKNPEQSAQRAKILSEHWRGQLQEMPRKRASIISSRDLCNYPQMLDVSLNAEGQVQKLDKKKINRFDFHKKPINQYWESFDQDTGLTEHQGLPFGHEMILDDKELDNKELQIYEDKKGRKECSKILEQPKKNQSLKGFLRFTVKQKILPDEHKLEHQPECLGGQSERVENQRNALETSLSLDKSRRSQEGKKKKRKKRQLDDVMTFDLEKIHEESASFDSPKEGMETFKGYQGAIKNTRKSETKEMLSPQREESEDTFSGGTEGKRVSNSHNVTLTSLCHQSGKGTILQKKTKKNMKDDINVLDAGVSYGSHVDAQSILGKQAEEEPLMTVANRTSKEDADILTRVTKSYGMCNSNLSRHHQVGRLKPLKKGAKKKLEDSKVLDVMAKSHGSQVSPQSTICLDLQECKTGNRKAKKVEADPEALNGMPESNVLQCNDSPSLYQPSDDDKSEENQIFRTAMVSPMAEDISEVVNHSEKSDGERESSDQEGQFIISCDGKVEEHNSVIPNHSCDGQPDKCTRGLVSSHLECERQATPYSIPFREIVKRVQMNPGDHCVLEIKGPLQDLVRGVLKIFASKTAPQGVKGWKPLAVYDKSTRSWSWLGPVNSSSPGHESLGVQTSSEAWGVSQKMLLKLVEAFANWLKNGQETLQQIVLLPSPPQPSMLTCLDEKERFRDLRAQKSLITITPSSPDMRAYFRRQEVLRYSVPDRAFAYTAADGRKAVVAPLRRCGGKPASKARDHFMLKPDRPPHVTILCLVRDAAARLPGSIGTRADVCTLIRDSQYIVEGVSDAQVNQVVSGALDRLHYERDPCVQFDGERKLWVYLHTERDEEDFEDDGTSSTKRWKRQKKENTDNSDLGPRNDSIYHCRDEQGACGSGLGFDFCSSNYNGESSSIYSGGKAELVYNRNGSLTSPRVLRSFNESNMEEGMVPFIELPPSIHSIPGSMRESHPMGWEVLELNPLNHGSNLKTHEHISDGDFDNDSFSRQRATELLSTSLL
ncbi:hypothetical protein SUGI_0829510 [Cryptomeria japonica]|nr:hypothetical protein SUGI_0829510 [Cryptomeria japonica]